MANQFQDALTLCGVNDDELMFRITVLQGVIDVESFIILTDKELDNLTVTINKMAPPAGGGPVVLNQLILKKMKAFRLWCLWQIRRDMGPPDLDEFDDDALKWGLERFAFETRCKDAEAPEQQMPDKLKSIGFDVWQNFWRQLEAYCVTIRGAFGIPIAYLLREHDEPTDEMRLADYPDSDAELMATVSLIGEEYLHDRKMLWGILTRLVGSGTAWPFIKGFESTYDARAALKTLKNQSQGTASDASRRARAYNILKVTMYTGKSSKHSWEWFVERLQYAFTELAETNCGLNEGQKVETLLSNVQAPALLGAVPVVRNDPNMLTSFSTLTGYFASLLVGNSGATPAQTRAVSAIDTDRQYSNAEWQALSPDHRRAITKKRRADKTKENAKKAKAATVAGGGGASSSNVTADSFKKLLKQKKQLKRKLKAVKTKLADSDDSDASSGEDTIVSGSRKSSKKAQAKA